LAPAHDLVSTDAYIPEDVSALKFHRSRSWDSFTYDELEIITGKARLPSHLIVATARVTVESFDQLWAQEKKHLPFPADVRAAIEDHPKRLSV
jgi:serine/threonine-protein kinase HipA